MKKIVVLLWVFSLTLLRADGERTKKVVYDLQSGDVKKSV